MTIEIQNKTGPKVLPVAMSTDALAAGEALAFGEGEDLALILRGQVICLADKGRVFPRPNDGWTVPTVFVARDCRFMDVVAVCDVQLVRMSLGTCRLLVETSDRFRRVFHQATSARLAGLRTLGTSENGGAYIH